MSNLNTESVVVIHSAFEKTPRTVAMVEVPADVSLNQKLEIAFEKTNSIDCAWWDNEGVTPMFPDINVCRSTSVGDMVLVGNVKWACKSDGWKKV